MASKHRGHNCDFLPTVDTTVAINQRLILGGVIKKSLPKKTKGIVILTTQRRAMDMLMNQYVQAASNKLRITDWASRSYVLVIWVPEGVQHCKLALKKQDLLLQGQP